MTQRGLCALGCALALFLFPSILQSGDRDEISTRLAVQNSLRRGRDMMNAQQYEEAVQVLETELEHANGSREYLTALRDAYRSYVQQLKLAKRENDAAVYERRLKILDPGSVLESAVIATSTPPAPVADSSKKQPTAPPAKAPEKPVVKETPPDQDNAKQKQAEELVTQARQAYDARHFDDALKLYDKANQVYSKAMAGENERWAYCKLNRVVDELAKGGSEPAIFNQLEREVRLAMSLAPTPRVEDLGKQILDRIGDKQRNQKGSGSIDTTPRAQGSGEGTVTVHHRSALVDGWQVAETQNIRIYHHKQPDLAENCAKLAEKTRVDMQTKWIGKTENWSPPCEIYLHDTADTYAAYTKVSRSLTGHSAIELDPGKGVVSRKVHVHCDDINLQVGTLRHEVTHVVIAGQFGDKLPPRWADEGVAVLTEPRERIDMHLRNLPSHNDNHQLFRVRDLMRMDDYPEGQRIGAFYAESVSLVDFLTHKQSPTVFMQFVRDGMTKGYDAALKKHYGYDGFEALENDWISSAIPNSKVTLGK